MSDVVDASVAFASGALLVALVASATGLTTIQAGFLVAVAPAVVSILAGN